MARGVPPQLRARRPALGTTCPAGPTDRRRVWGGTLWANSQGWRRRGNEAAPRHHQLPRF